MCPSARGWPGGKSNRKCVLSTLNITSNIEATFKNVSNSQLQTLWFSTQRSFVHPTHHVLPRTREKYKHNSEIQIPHVQRGTQAKEPCTYLLRSAWVTPSITKATIKGFVSKLEGTNGGHKCRHHHSPHPLEATQSRVSHEDFHTAAESLERVPDVPIAGCFKTQTPTESKG